MFMFKLVGNLMTDLKQFKEAVVVYEMHSPHVGQILNNWDTQNRIIPKD